MPIDAYTAYQSVESGNAPGTVKGKLPNDGAVEAFRYRHFYDGFFSFDGIDQIVGGGGEKVTMYVHIQILASPDGPVLFEQIVEIDFLVLIQVVAGSIGFFFWSPANNGERITTTICDGQAVPLNATTGKPEGWRFVDTPVLTDQVEFGDTRIGDPDDNSDDITASGSFTADGGYISGAWISPAYRCNLPAGAVLKVVSQKWASARVGRERDATYQFSFKGQPSFAALIDGVFALRSALSRGTDIDLYETFGAVQENELIRTLDDIREPSTWKDECNRWHIAGWSGVGPAARYRIFYSEDDGRSPLIPLSYENEAGEDVIDDIWDVSLYTLPKAIRCSNGEIATIAIKGGYIWFKSSLDNFADETLVAAVKRSEDYLLLEEPGTGRLIVTNCRDASWDSDNFGSGAWSPVTSDVTPAEVAAT